MCVNPPGEKEPVGYRALAPVDRFLDKHRIPVLAGTALVVLLGLPLLFHLRFDFNPINLRSPKVESIATYLDLRTDPEVAGNPIEVLASSQAEADCVAARIAKVPEVDHVTPGQTALFNAHEDSVECAKCGGRMVRAGTCYTCRDCGTSTGCG